MSEAPPEAPAAASRGGNVFTRKIGPLPMWIWLVIVAAVILAYELYKSKSSGSSAGDTTSAADVPQFVNQVYTSPNPPVAGPPVPPDPDDGGGGGKKPPGHHKPPVAFGPERREATGKESLSQIARERHTTVAHLIAVTRTSQITPANLKRFLAAAAHPNRKLPKGLIYYTSH